jgi:hypothetical protein
MSGPPYLTAAIFSAFLPGLGQLLKRHYAKAAEVFAMGLMIETAWYFGYVFDGPFTPFLLYGLVPVAAVFWWGRQVHDAYSSASPGSLFPVLPLPSRGSLDLQAIGFLFLLTAFTDLYIIQARPDYGLKILGTALPGAWGVISKAQSPTLHILIGIGFLLVKRWGLLVYLVYAGFGIINAGVNLAVLPGPHRIRIIFMISLAVFTTYILWRRKRFSP